jgi:D-2-hydroxyacid dehydrogenase (NADP+)
MKLLIIDEKDYAERYRSYLQPKFPEVRFTEVHSGEAARGPIREADILLTYANFLSDDLIRAASRLRWIQAQTTGVDGIVDLPSLGKDVIVTSTRGIHAPPVSELAVLMMLALNRDLPGNVRNQDRRIWDRWPGKVLHRKTVGILGVGTISEALARQCKAFGMSVIGFTSTPRSTEHFDRMARRSELVQHAPELDYLVILAPLTPETRDIVDEKVFAAMKPTSYLINVGRGGVVKEDALLEALRSGSIAGAGLDAFANEPLDHDHPFWAMENVIVTPHVGGRYDQIVDYKLPIFERNLRLFLDGDYAHMMNLVRR